jgi:hypothetical protein
MAEIYETITAPIYNTKGMKPGVIEGARLFPLKNTCKPCKRSGRGKLGKIQKKLGERRVAHATTLKSLPQNVNPAGFRCPGSMNPKK